MTCCYDVYFYLKSGWLERWSQIQIYGCSSPVCNKYLMSLEEIYWQFLLPNYRKYFQCHRTWKLYGFIMSTLTLPAKKLHRSIVMNDKFPSQTKNSIHTKRNKRNIKKILWYIQLMYEGHSKYKLTTLLSCANFFSKIKFNTVKFKIIYFINKRCFKYFFELS